MCGMNFRVVALGDFGRSRWKKVCWLSAAVPAGNESGSFPDVPGRTHGEDAFIAAGEKHPFQKAATLIVQEVFVPFIFHQLRDDYDNAARWIFLSQIENELNDGNDDKAVGGRQDVKLRWFLALRAERAVNVLLPVVLE